MIKESLLVTMDKPLLNKQVKSLKLELFWLNSTYTILLYRRYLLLYKNIFIKHVNIIAVCSSLGRFEYRFIKLYMLISSDSVHYVMKCITKGWGNAGGSQRWERRQLRWSSLVRMSESRFLKRRYVENQIPPLVLFLVPKITAEALWFLKVQQVILTFGPFGPLIILGNLFNFFLIFAEFRFRQKSWYSVNFV